MLCDRFELPRWQICNRRYLAQNVDFVAISHACVSAPANQYLELRSSILRRWWPRDRIHRRAFGRLQRLSRLLWRSAMQQSCLLNVRVRRPVLQAFVVSPDGQTILPKLALPTLASESLTYNQGGCRKPLFEPADRGDRAALTVTWPHFAGS